MAITRSNGVFLDCPTSGTAPVFISHLMDVPDGHPIFVAPHKTVADRISPGLYDVSHSAIYSLKQGGGCVSPFGLDFNTHRVCVLRRRWVWWNGERLGRPVLKLLTDAYGASEGTLVEWVNDDHVQFGEAALDLNIPNHRNFLQCITTPVSDDGESFLAQTQLARWSSILAWIRARLTDDFLAGEAVRPTTLPNGKFKHPGLTDQLEAQIVTYPDAVLTRVMVNRIVPAPIPESVSDSEALVNWINDWYTADWKAKHPERPAPAVDLSRRSDRVTGATAVEVSPESSAAVTQEAPVATAQETLPPPPPSAPLPMPAPRPTMRYNGELVGYRELDVTVRETQYQVVHERRRNQYSGTMAIPDPVVAQGEDAVRRYIKENYSGEDGMDCDEGDFESFDHDGGDTEIDAVEADIESLVDDFVLEVGGRDDDDDN